MISLNFLCKLVFLSNEMSKDSSAKYYKRNNEEKVG